MNWKQREKLASTQLSTYSSPSGQRPAAFAKAPIDRDHIVVAEMLDHHEQHRCRSWRPLGPRDARRAQTLSGGGCPSIFGRSGSKHAHFGAELDQMVAVGARQIGIVKRSRANEDDRRPLFRLAEHLGAALGAKAPVHGRAAVGLADVVAQRTGYGDIFLAEKRADRAGSAAEILAHAAPAISRAERRLRPDLVPHRPAQTSARDRQEKSLPTVSDQTYEKSAAPASERGGPPAPWSRRLWLRKRPRRITKIVQSGSGIRRRGWFWPSAGEHASHGNHERLESRSLLRRASGSSALRACVRPGNGLILRARSSAPETGTSPPK